MEDRSAVFTHCLPAPAIGGPFGNVFREKVPAGRSEKNEGEREWFVLRILYSHS